MLFNSVIFIIFACLFFAVWPCIKKWNNTAWAFLTVSSFVFYGWWNWYFLSLIIISGLIDYFAALAIVKKPDRKKLFLILSLLGNLGSLALFKYSGFVTENLDYVFGQLGFTTSLYNDIPHFFKIVPVGISFYTFQSMSYTIDVYKGKFKPTRNVLHFFAYLSMFPQLVAGPIVRACDLLPQLENMPDTTEESRWEGVKLILVGFFKKVVIADNLGIFVNTAFANVTAHSQTSYWWLMMIFFAVQIYCDFSGYSDIARGLAKWMGLEFPLNFNHPYVATSLSDFWARWHISLSTWFRDYVYLPLGGNRKGKVRTYVNLFVTMMLSGLWHGAAWNYIIWGGLHALFLMLEKLLKIPERVGKILFGKPILWALTMLQVMIGWVFFRADTLTEAVFILKMMFIPRDSLIPDRGGLALFYLGALILFEIFIAYNLWKKIRLSRKTRLVYEILFWPALAVIVIFLRGPAEQFIYFQF